MINKAKFFPHRVVSVVAAVCVLSLTHQAVHASKPNDNAALKRFSAGIDVNPKPNVRETGLPIYPGAIVERDETENVNGVNLDLWFGSYGMKLVVVKLKTDDSADKVEAFYRDALAERGVVLDCSGAKQKIKNDSGKTSSIESAEERRARRQLLRESERAAKKANIITCDEMQLGKSDSRDGKYYKAGTRASQYGAAVQPNGNGATFQLMHFVKRGSDE